jgi:hypothetical protein
MHGYGQMMVKGFGDHHAVYNGFFAENIEEGEGCMRYMDGHVYTGQLVQGLKSMLVGRVVMYCLISLLCFVLVERTLFLTHRWRRLSGVRAGSLPRRMG